MPLTYNFNDEIDDLIGKEDIKEEKKQLTEHQEEVNNNV